MDAVSGILISASEDTSIKIWKPMEEDCFTNIQTLQKDRYPIRCLAYGIQKKRRLIFAGNKDAKIMIWTSEKLSKTSKKITNFSLLQTIKEELYSINCLLYDQDSEFLYSGGDYKEVI